MHMDSPFALNNWPGDFQKCCRVPNQVKFSDLLFGSICNRPTFNQNLAQAFRQLDTFCGIQIERQRCACPNLLEQRLKETPLPRYCHS